MGAPADDRFPTLLCVDDEPVVLQLLRDYFALKGFHVVTATNGVQAFLQAVRWRPQAVILDLFMPRLGGLAALERIRGLAPDIVVILISGVPNAVETLQEAGLTVTGAFTKPVELDRILETLARAAVVPSERPPGWGAEKHSAPAILRALVVDDDPEVREFLADYLKENGFETAEAWDGEEAIRRIPEFPPHLVLLDVLMPGLSGLETFRRIKTLLPKTCVVMVSGHEDKDTAQRALEMGAVDYLLKPVNLAHLDSLLGIHPGKD